MQGKASADHTTLLLNCYTKLKAVDKLDHFLKGTGAADGTGPLKFDVETAVKVRAGTGAVPSVLQAWRWYTRPCCCDLALLERRGLSACSADCASCRTRRLSPGTKKKLPTAVCRILLLLLLLLDAVDTTAAATAADTATATNAAAASHTAAADDDTDDAAADETAAAAAANDDIADAAAAGLPHSRLL